MQESTVTRSLVCALSEDDLLERGDQMAAAELRAEQLKYERKRLNAGMREQADKRAELASVIENKRELRDVACEWRPDYDGKVWRLHRSDTDAEVETRDMTDGDLQGRLFDAESTADAKPRKKRTKKAKRDAKGDAESTADAKPRKKRTKKAKSKTTAAA